METSAILEEIRDAIAADAAVEAFCVETFGKAGTVWIGLDEDNPIPDADYPCIVILEASPSDVGSVVKSWKVAMGFGVICADIDSDGKKRTYAGLLHCEDLRELAELAVKQAIPGKVAIDGKSSRISYYPKFVSFASLTIEKMTSKRRT